MPLGETPSVGNEPQNCMLVQIIQQVSRFLVKTNSGDVRTVDGQQVVDGNIQRVRINQPLKHVLALLPPFVHPIKYPFKPIARFYLGGYLTIGGQQIVQLLIQRIVEVEDHYPTLLRHRR